MRPNHIADAAFTLPPVSNIGANQHEEEEGL